MSKYLFILSLTILLFGNIHSNPPLENKYDSQLQSLEIDNDTYITTQNIFMFVTNHGSFGRDLSDIFGHDFGTWFPFTTIDDIINNTDSAAYRPIIYGAGVWLGGKVNGETRIAASEYGSEFVPGPMIGGTFQSDQPDFRVYKLYSDLYCPPLVKQFLRESCDSSYRFLQICSAIGNPMPNAGNFHYNI